MHQLNILIILYTLLTSFIIIQSKDNQKKRRICLVINGLILCWFVFPLLSAVVNPYLQILFDWSPLLILPLLHQQTALLTTGFNRRSYDSHFIKFEGKYFPKVMNLHQQNRANSKLLSEYLHLCYLSFYILIYGIPLYFYLQHEWIAFYQSTFIMLFILFSCYLTHGIIPVYGPRNIFKKINDHRSEGYFFRLVHKILESGSTPGTAFPSGHTGAACVALLITWYWNLSLFYCILPFALGLIISTIYGRFHYVVDVIIGALYALLSFSITDIGADIWKEKRFI